MKIKTLLWALVLLVVINVAFYLVLKFPLWRIGGAFQIGASVSAKLACSGKYIVGQPLQQIKDDLASYTPANRAVELTFDDDKKRVDADFWGMAQATAQFRPVSGCALEWGDSRVLDDIQITQVAPSNALWPAGEQVNSIVAEYQSKLEALVAEDNRQGLNTRAYIVLHRGKIVAETYAQGFDQHAPMLGWSMGKSIMAMLLGQLQHQGVLDDRQKGLFSAWQGDERVQVSLKNLLQMSSGLDFGEIYSPGNDAVNMLFTEHSMSDYAMQSELEFTPGSHFAYSSGTTNLLSRIFYQQVGGTAQAQYTYLYQQFFQPMGMRNAWFESDSSGVLVGSSYPYLRARDWARLAQLLLNGGELNGQRFLDPKWIEQAFMPNSSDNEQRYGYQFWLNGNGDNKRNPDLPDDMVFMHGNRSQVVALFPSQQIAIIRLGWTSGSYPENQRFAQVLRWLQ